MAIPFLNNVTLNNNEVQNVKLHNTGSAPNNAAGQIYFDTSDNLAKYYSNGTDLWINLKEYSFSNGTYIDVTTSGTTPKPILTLDISAVDGTAGAGERYLTKSNTWAEVSAIPGTYTWTVAGDTGSETVASGDTITFVGGTNISTSYNSTSNELVLNHDVVTNTPTTSTASPAHGGTFTAIDSITVSSEGHVTGVNTKTVTLPADNNTDTLQSIAADSTNNDRYITTVANASGAQTGLSHSTLTYNPSTETLNVTNLVVSGTSTTINTEEINLADNIILLNSNYAGSSPTENAGIEVERGTVDSNVSLVWNETSNRWTFTNDGTTFYNIPISSEYDNFNFNVQVGGTSQEVADGGTVTFAQGGGLTVGISGDDTITYSHADTSSQSSVNNSGRTYIQDITLDDYGHITGITSATETVTNTDTQLATAAALIDVSAMGANTTASFTHGLASKNLIVQLYDVTTGEVVFADIDHTSNNAISVTFATTPTNDIRVVVIDAKDGITDSTVTYS